MLWGCLPAFRSSRKVKAHGDDEVFENLSSVGKMIPPQVHRNDSNLTSTLSTRSTLILSEGSRVSVTFAPKVDKVYFNRRDPPSHLYGMKQERKAPAGPCLKGTTSRSVLSINQRRVERRHQVMSSLY